MSKRVGELKPQGQAPHLGRPRDASHDERILRATIDTLAEFGYERTTMEMVASRAGTGKATVYRRWRSKEDLLIEAVAWMKRSQVNLEALPDTGSLRGDLLGLFRLSPSREEEKKTKVMGELASLLSRSPELAEAGAAAIVDPWAAAHRILIQRAVDRGEFHAAIDVEMASQVIPSMASYRTLVQRKTFEYDWLVALIDGVLLPAFRSDKREHRRV